MTQYKTALWVSSSAILLACLALQVYAQETESVSASSSTSTELVASTTVFSSASSTAAQLINQSRAVLVGGNDTTKPEELSEKTAILSLFEARPVESPLSLSFMAYWVQQAVQEGIPANTIYLILLTPFLALFVSFTRIVIGLPTLDMLVPIALAFTFVAVGISIGLLVLVAILFASYMSKRSLAKVRIMFYPKRSLSMFFLALAVFAALSVGLALEFERILSLSIFPILILMLLGDQIVTVQLHKSSYETLLITSTTIMLGLLGFILASSETMQNTLILYPELVFVVIPLNLMIGRYFGLRVLEMLRFNKVLVE